MAVLLLLQARKQVTAAEVAAELEVSERTARRDLEALGMAGLPVYAVQGRGGGWRLAGSGRTDLSGLTAAEVRALFLMAGPAAAGGLAGVGAAGSSEVRAALRKLVRAVPEGFRAQAEAASSAMVIDPSGWDGQGGVGAVHRRPPRWLDDLQQAVIEGVQVRLGYVARDRASSSRVVHPLGLAAKGAGWYLVADTERGLRTFRVDRVMEVELLEDRVVRPEGFELTEAWKLITDELDQRRAPLRAEVRAWPRAVPWCRAVFGNRVRIGGTGEDGRVELEVRGHSPGSLAAELSPFGTALEVLEPAEVREALGRLGAALVATYG